MHGLKRIVSILLLALLVEPMWADSFFTVANNDISVMFLTNVFGNVGNVLVGSSNQLMGKLLGYFNLGVVIFAGGFIIHNVIRSTFGSAQSLEGSQGTAWSTIRIISGVTLIVPQFSGYSLLQVLVMWTVVKGIAVADYLWTEVLDYTNSMGGGVYQVTTPSDYDYIAAYIGSSNNVALTSSLDGRAYINDYVASSVCMEAASENNAAINTAAEILGNTTGNADIYGIQWGETCKITCHSLGLDDSSSLCIDGYASNVVCFGSTASPTLCGGYAWGKQDGGMMSDSENTALRAALDSVTMFAASLGSSLYSTAYGLAQSGADSASIQASLSEDCLNADQATQCTWGNDLVMASSMYYAGIKPLLIVDDVDTADWQSDDNWYYTASEHGWIVAGMYYFNLVGSDSSAQTSLAPVNTYQVEKVKSRSSLNTVSSEVSSAYQGSLLAMSNFTSRALNIIKTYVASSLVSSTVAAEDLTDSMTSSTDTTTTSSTSTDTSTTSSTSTDTTSSSSTTSTETTTESDGADFSEEALEALTVDGTNYDLVSSVLNALLARSITNLALTTSYGDSLQESYFITGTKLYLVQYNIHSMLARVMAKFLGINILKTDDSLLFCSTSDCSSADYDPFASTVTDSDDDTSDGGATACGTLASVTCNLNVSHNALTNGDCWAGFVNSSGACLNIGQGIAGQIYANSKGYRYDPMRGLAQLGLTMIQTAVSYWLYTTEGLMNVNEDLMWAYFGVSVALGALSSVLDGVTSLAGGGSTGLTILSGVATTALTAMSQLLGIGYQWDVARLTFFSPVGSAIATLIFTIGMVFAYYVPALPLMLFVFTVMGWFILVLEAMIAAPLLALGMTHPAGHDLLGRAEQSLILLLGVFLRPAAIIIGLIAAAVLSYNVMIWVNLGFAMVMNQYFSFLTTLSLINGVGLKLVGTVAVYALYAYSIVNIVNFLFSLIYQVPDRLTRWIGGQPEYSSAQQMASEVQSGLQGAGQGIGQGAGQVAGKGATHEQGASAKTAKSGGRKESDSEASNEDGKGGGNDSGTSGGGNNAGTSSD